MVKIRMIGCEAVHPADFVYDIPENHGYCLLILTRTPAIFWNGEEARQYPENHAAFFAPESRAHYRACQDKYINDWIIFESDEKYVTEFPVKAEPFPIVDVEYCRSLFRLLTWEHTGNRDERVVSRLMEVLFHKLEANVNMEETDAYSRPLLMLRRMIINNPQREWKVADMAEILHISQGHLQMLYRREFGVSCMEDVIQGRILLARDYLSHTNLSISEISALCGYNSIEHFSRQFKKITGMPPLKFRSADN